MTQEALMGCTVAGTYAEISVSKALSSNYAPVYVECPSDLQWLRPAIGLNPKEANWVSGRKHVVGGALSTYLKHWNWKTLTSPHT